MKVITLNANGVRAAARKGLFEWLDAERADVVCLQETKAQEHQLDGSYCPPGYHCRYHDAERKGYSGVAVFARVAPDRLLTGYGVEEFDTEGRLLEARFGRLSVISLYAPSGSSGPERQASKDRFLDSFLPYLRSLRRKRRDYIICGDWNIAHRAIDLRNWKSNQKNSGFLPHERAWMDELFGRAGFVDAFRVVNPEPEQYTWWSNRGRAWEKNVGWRLDYQVVTPRLRERVLDARIYKEQRFSDHAPLIMRYDLDLPHDGA